MSRAGIIYQLFYFSLWPIFTYRAHKIAVLFLPEIIVALALSTRKGVDWYVQKSVFQKISLHVHIIIVILLDPSCKSPLLKLSL
jgi:glucose-6-phosphate-specific signal transduction histidine kinase